MENVQITSEGIKRALKKYDYSSSIVEYIWNGFDAGASKIDLIFIANEIGHIQEFKIIDNGQGIVDPKKFQPFFESEKVIDPNAKRVSSRIHGKNGIGRLTFFTFAFSAKWSTVFQKDGKRYKYCIDINLITLDQYNASNPVETNEPTGTTVSFLDIHTLSKYNFESKVIENICLNFAWFLELNNGNKKSININGKSLEYSKDTIGEIEEIQHKINSFIFKIKYVRWLKSLNKEYSRYYCIDSNNNEKYTNTTTLNNKGDRFFHSVFITSNFFDSENIIVFFEGELYKDTDEAKVSKELLDYVNQYLRNKRKPFLKNVSDSLIKKLEKQGVFPEFKNNQWDQFRKSELENIVIELYQVEPTLFTYLNIPQKKVFVRFLNLILDSGERDKLFEVLENIIDLESSDLDQLAETLKTTRMSNIVKTIKLIEDRYRAINQLKNLVFRSELAANERDHLQKFIEKHYWIFGEQYHLVTAAEPKFEKALRRFIYHLRGEKPVVSVNHPDKNKEMDIFMVRQALETDTINNIVVELKHPKINLGSKELEQVKKYMRVILEQDEFNASNMTWEFYLIGNDFKKDGYIDGEIKNAKSHGEKSLVFSVDKYKIYVKKWSEIFSEFELKHNFLNEKLELERIKLISEQSSADEIINSIDTNSAIQPPEIAISDN